MNAPHVLGHVLFWVIIMLTYAASEWGYRNDFREAILFELVFLPIRLIAVYVNWFVLIPRLLYRYRMISYLLSLGILLFVLAILQRYITLYWAYPTFFPTWMKEAPQPWIFFRIMQNLVIITSPVAFSTGIKLFMDWYRQRRRSRQLEIEKQKAELKYLKSQINPHFLFNTLNNLYGLAMEKSNRLPGLILKLSDFLSYSLYESNVDQISVEKEIGLVRDFVELEVDRYEKRVAVHWDIDPSTFAFPIFPLLFMPLVENAFKHGVREEVRRADIWIRLSTDHDQLVFEVVNTIAESPPTESGGIGLQNLRKRLRIRYGDQHTLENRRMDERYYATLKIPVHG